MSEIGTTLLVGGLFLLRIGLPIILLSLAGLMVYQWQKVRRIKQSTETVTQSSVKAPRK